MTDTSTDPYIKLFGISSGRAQELAGQVMSSMQERADMLPFVEQVDHLQDAICTHIASMDITLDELSFLCFEFWIDISKTNLLFCSHTKTKQNAC